MRPRPLTRPAFRAVALAAVVATFGPGCSWLFVDGPPPRERRSSYYFRPCTETNGVPVLDAALATLNLVGVAAALASSGERGGDDSVAFRVPVGMAWTVVFAASAGTGFVRTSECRAYMADVPGRSPRRSAPPVWRPDGKLGAPADEEKAEDAAAQARSNAIAGAQARQAGLAAGRAAQNAGASPSAPSPAPAEPASAPSNP